MSSMTTKVNDVVGLGSHDDSKQPSSLTSSSSGVPTSVRNSSSSTGASEQSTLSPDTAQASSARSSGRKLSDAALMPPSVFRQLVGEPTIEHNYPQDSTTKRHSVSHQESHYLR